MSRLSESALGAWWNDVPAQTRLIGGLGVGAVVVVALIVFMLVPSIKTLRYAAVDQQALDTQVDLMRNLSGQAQAIKSQPKPSSDEARKFIENSVKQRLASTGQVSFAGERATVSLNNARAEAVSAWLTDTRTNGRLLPVEAKLTRGEAGWTGQVVLNLPAAK